MQSVNEELDLDILSVAGAIKALRDAEKKLIKKGCKKETIQLDVSVYEDPYNRGVSYPHILLIGKRDE